MRWYTQHQKINYIDCVFVRSRKRLNTRRRTGLELDVLLRPALLKKSISYSLEVHNIYIKKFSKISMFLKFEFCSYFRAFSLCVCVCVEDLWVNGNDV